MSVSALCPSFRSIGPLKFPAPVALRSSAQVLRRSIPASATAFSTTARLQKRNKGARNEVDPRITAIRYHLAHPLTPRPLHFSRTRFLRHWTIHRAWLLFLRKQRYRQERELERQYESMRAACEHLRLLDDNGMRVSEAEGGGQGPDPGTLGPRGKEVGRLYRGAMGRRGLAGSVPVEYARGQVDFPGRERWNYNWTRN